MTEMTYWIYGAIVTAIVVIVPILIFIGFNVYNRFESASPNEWLLVIHDGKLRKCGVGISLFRGLNETVVKFPSLLNKVTFSAKQVSKEMQGVELSGFIIWVINREDNCPLKAYRHIKNLSSLKNDSDVNMHIKSMAESIVRHQIANLGINKIISQRKKVRDGIVGEMQEILNGWGVWLETVEITEVKILSNSLFQDLQQPFRSSTRETADKIKIESSFKISTIRNQKDMEAKLRKQKQEQQLTKQREIIKRSNVELKNETLMLECTMNLKIQKEKQKIEMDKIKHSLQVKQLEQDFELKKISDRYAIDAKMTDINMKKQILSTVESIYKNMNVDSMRIVNFGNNQGLEYGVGKMAMALRDIGNQLNDNDNNNTT